MTAELINAIAALLGAVAWPVIVLVVVLIYRTPVAKLIESLESLTIPGGFEAKLRRAVEKAAEQQGPAGAAAEAAVTPAQVEAAERVGQLTTGDRREVARREMLELAREYERTRAAMPSSDERTRRLGAVARKMRALAVACRPYLEAFRDSGSPGGRLAAVSILELSPSYPHLGWLADRLDSDREAAFIGYHAALALQAAARAAGSPAERQAVAAAIESAGQWVRDKPASSDRRQRLAEAAALLANNTGT